METLTNQNSLLFEGSRLELRGKDANGNPTGTEWVTVDKTSVTENKVFVVHATSRNGYKSVFLINEFNADGNAINTVELSGVGSKRQFVGGVPLMTIEPWVSKKSRGSQHT